MTAPAIRALLAVHAAARERTADDHMFTVSRGGERASTFRLQLFTGPGTRPVAVVTQLAGTEGGSLTNLARRCAAEVWRRHFPDSAGPPVWVTLELRPSPAARFMLVTFDVAGLHRLASPRWCAMADGELARLVGGPVSRDRGERYEPWPNQADPEPVYRVAWTILLPRPHGVDRGCIRHAPPWWRCLARQVIPRRAARGCCYYHGINWRQVSAAAIRVMRQARRDGLHGEALSAQADELAAAQGLPPEEEEALVELLSDHSGIQPGPRISLGRRYYGNGRHRTTAMLDAGVRRTVVIRWRYPAPRHLGRPPVPRPLPAGRPGRAACCQVTDGCGRHRRDR